MNRRNFVFKSYGYAISTFIAANASVYVIGSAFKELDGSLVAGAKTCAPQIGPAVCPVSIPAGNLNDILSYDPPTCLAAGGSGVGGIIADCDAGPAWHIQGL